MTELDLRLIQWFPKRHHYILTIPLYQKQQNCYRAGFIQVMTSFITGHSLGNKHTSQKGPTERLAILCLRKGKHPLPSGNFNLKELRGQLERNKGEHWEMGRIGDVHRCIFKVLLFQCSLIPLRKRKSAVKSSHKNPPAYLSSCDNDPSFSVLSLRPALHFGMRSQPHSTTHGHVQHACFFP